MADGSGRPVKELHGSVTYHESETPPGITLSSNQYQIWSDVLGKPMTRIHTDGTKLDTRVYMGEAEAWKLEDPGEREGGSAGGRDVRESTIRFRIHSQIRKIRETGGEIIPFSVGLARPPCAITA